MKYLSGTCSRCGGKKEDHFHPQKYPDELYCSTDVRDMAMYLEAIALTSAPKIPKQAGPPRPPKLEVSPRIKRGPRTKMANVIRELRKMTGLTQERFAQQLSIKRSLLGAYEEGRAEPRIELLHRMTKAAGVSIEQLLNIVYDRSRSKA